MQGISGLEIEEILGNFGEFLGVPQGINRGNFRELIEGISGNFRKFQGVSGLEFQGISGLGIARISGNLSTGNQGNSREFHGISGNFKAGISGNFREFQDILGIFREFQGISGSSAQDQAGLCLFLLIKPINFIGKGTNSWTLPREGQGAVKERRENCL